MVGDARAPELAALAAALATGHGIALPASLMLFELAGGRPSRVVGRDDAQPWHVLGRGLEEGLPAEVRRLGAHYTPPPVAAQVVRRGFAPGVSAGPVVDPACGGGALLLEAAELLVELGIDRATVARELLWGADIDPLAVAVAEAAIALWSGGTAPAEGRLVVADALTRERVHLWPDAPAEGFAAVVGNPPFQNQLSASTMRDDEQRRALRARFGPAARGYIDTATVFLLAAVGLAAPGGRIAMVQPQSTAGARHAEFARQLIGERATLLEVVALPSGSFAASVDVCVVVLEVGPPVEPTVMWTVSLATARGIPSVDLGGGPTLRTTAEAVAGFRQHYYGIVGHVRELADAEPGVWGRRLVTCGAIDVGRSRWGERVTRFAKRSWDRPVVDVDGAVATLPALGDWFERLDRPKVLVASQTRVTEAVADRAGTWIPGVPAIAVIPVDPGDVDRVAAAICAPPVAAWAAHRACGTGMSADSIRLSASLLLDVPLPTDRDAWDEAARLLATGELRAYRSVATAMYALPPDTAKHVVTWWDVASAKR